MTPTILLASLVVVLVGYRLLEPRCRWLAKWWKWERQTSARVDAMKRKMGLTFLPVMESALAELDMAASHARVAIVEFGESITDLAQAVTESRLDVIESAWER